MAYVPERASINQRVQVGAESLTAMGTPVAANKQLECFDFQFGPGVDLLNYAPTGHKYDTIQELNEEWVDGTMGGNGDFNGLIYPLSGAMGAITPVASGESTTAKDWAFVPPIVGLKQPQSFTFQQGDSTRAHQVPFGLYTQFGYSFTRKTFTVSGKILGQQLNDGITMTANPTSVPLAPIVPSQVNVYLDPTQAELGTTQLMKFLAGEYTMDSIYGPAWFVNRAQPSFSNFVDMKPTCTFKMTLEADANGMTPLSYMRTGVTYYLRVEAIGAEIDADNSVNNSFVHDMAIKIGKPDNFSDSDDIFAIAYTCTIVEDATWGKSQMLTLTNLLTAL